MDQISGGVPLDECVPGLLLAMSGPGRQVNDHRVTARRVSAGRRKGTGATAGVPAAPVLRAEMRDCGRRPCWVGLCYGSACPGSHDLRADIAITAMIPTVMPMRKKTNKMMAIPAAALIAASPKE
jgi:hypothetical protein